MGLTKSQRHNRMLDRIMSPEAIDIGTMSPIVHAEWVKFWDANPHMTMKESVRMFRHMETLPF